jgi:hypothetical protein
MPPLFLKPFFESETILINQNIFPEMKLRDLLPNFYIHVTGSDLFIPKICLIWTLYFPLLHERTLGSTHRSREKGRELPPIRGWRQFPALPSAPAVEPSVHINDQHTNFQFGKLWIANGNN